MKNYLKSIVSLTVICAVVAALLAVTDQFTAPIIEKNDQAKASGALLDVLPDGGTFEQVDLTAYELPATVQEAYTASNGGAVVQLNTTGYGPDMIIMCGVDANGAVSGAVCLSSNETLGKEQEYGSTLVGATADTIDSMDTIAGATMTTSNYRNAVKDALNSAIILGGGSVDIRSEEEIIADSLAEALPEGDAFTEVFLCEELDGVSAVYAADNGSGSVYVVGEGEEAQFVGVDASGTVLSDVPADVKANVEAQAAIMAASSMEEVDLTQYADMPSHIDQAFKTASGNYVLRLHAAGFGINGDAYYNPSGEYIYIKVAVTPDGRIISCFTEEQHESENIGDACGKKEFYTRFNGATEDTLDGIDGISGATFTSKGYKTGLSKAFEAVKLMEGVA